MRRLEIICEVCPTSCLIKATVRGAELVKIIGNKCEKGENFVLEETTNPRRILTSTVRVQNGENEVVSIKTDKPIPRNLLFLAAKELSKIRLEAPVEPDQIIVGNLLSTGAKVIATKGITRSRQWSHSTKRNG